MRQRRYSLPGKNGFFTISENEDCEYANPIEWFRDSIMGHSGNLTFNFLLLSLDSSEPPVIPSGYQPIEFIRQVAKHDAGKTWNNELTTIINAKVPDALWQALAANSKKEQQKTLKNLTISSEQLIAFYFRAFKRLGYLFSNYTLEYLPGGTDATQMPGLAYIEEDKTVTVVGETTYSEKQLKQAIQHRRRRIVRFLDKDSEWHCIFYDYRSMNGEETDSRGPHVHYISDKWGLTRRQVLDSLRQKKYSLPSLHIGFEKEID